VTPTIYQPGTDAQSLSTDGRRAHNSRAKVLAWACSD
jgi:hypothetical protein